MNNTLQNLFYKPLDIYFASFKPSKRRSYNFAVYNAMKANFPLSDLELNVEDDILEQAELLEAGSAIKALTEVEKNLWVARINDVEGLIETEIQLIGSKVKSFTCDCSIFNKLTVCPHIAAALMILRRRKVIEKESKDAQKALKKLTPETPTKITIPYIIKRIDSAQLIEFIADYARQDKQFALALKTRFTGDLMDGNFAEHYKALIDNTLRAAKNPKGKLTPKGWLQFFTMLDELKQKAESFFKIGELNESFDLIKLSLPLVHRYLRSHDSPHVKLAKRQTLLLEILRGYSGLLLSPELSENIWDFMLHEYAQNAKFRFADIIFDWIIKNTDSNIRTEKVIQVLDNQIVATRGNFDAQDRLLTQKIQILQKSGRVEEASQMILGASQNPEVLFFAVQNSIENNDLVLAKSLCLNGLRIFKNSNIVLEQLEEFLLKIAVKESDTPEGINEEVLHLAEKRFLKTLNFDYFNLLKKYHIPSNKIKTITQSLENQPYKVEKRDALAAIYFTEKHYDKLTEMIKNLQSLELLRRFGLELWRVDKAAGFDLHKTILYEYLFTHLGRPPAQRLRTLLESHIEKDGFELAEALMTAFKTDFPERFSLKEELDDMLTDLEKKDILRQV